MASRLTLKLIDFDRDTIQVSFDGADSSAGTYTADLAAAEALADAIEGVTLGTRVERNFIADREYNATPTPPGSALAQTNIQWVAEYTDNVNGRVFRTRIGTADLTLATTIVNGVPSMPLGAGAGSALKTAFEAYVLSEDGNAVTLQAVYYKE